MLEKMKENKKKIIAIIAIVVAVGIIISFKLNNTNEKSIGDNSETNSSITATDKKDGNHGEGELKPITEGEFVFEVEKPLDYKAMAAKKLPVIGAYGSEGCGPCRAFEPTLIRLNREFKGKAFIKYIDVWKHSDGAAGIPVRVIPTQNFVDKDGNPYNPAPEKIAKYQLQQVKDENGKLLYTLHQGPMKYEYLVEILNDMMGK